jgi:hypothetical protein
MVRTTAEPPARPAVRAPTRLGRWVLLCAGAEAVGMAAAAGAARAATALAPDRTALAWGLVVAAGLVEGTALGLAQSAALRPDAPGLRRRHWVLMTVAVAGLGWAAVSAPAVLGGDDGAGAGPSALLVASGAAGLGLLMGAVLGAAQAGALRGTVARPWRWVGVSATAWTPAMVVIFAGATAAPATWSDLAVVALGAGTGALAGAVLGAVSGVLVPVLGRVAD